MFWNDVMQHMQGKLSITMTCTRLVRGYGVPAQWKMNRFSALDLWKWFLPNHSIKQNGYQQEMWSETDKGKSSFHSQKMVSFQRGVSDILSKDSG